MTTVVPPPGSHPHDHHIEVLRDVEGWRVIERTGAVVLREAHYADWHRVERARRAFAIERLAVTAEGWASTAPPRHSTNR